MGYNWISWKVLMFFLDIYIYIICIFLKYLHSQILMLYWVYLVCQNLSFCKVEIDTPFFSAAWQYLFVHSWMQHVFSLLPLCWGSRLRPVGRFAKRERVFEEGHVFSPVVLRELRSYAYPYMKWGAQEPLRVSQPDHSVASHCCNIHFQRAMIEVTVSKKSTLKHWAHWSILLQGNIYPMGFLRSVLQNDLHGCVITFPAKQLEQQMFSLCGSSKEWKRERERERLAEQCACTSITKLSMSLVWQEGRSIRFFSISIAIWVTTFIWWSEE